MNATRNAEPLKAQLVAIANATDFPEKRDIVTEILNENAMIDRLSRGVMAALIASPWIDEAAVAASYANLRGDIKDAIMDKIMMVDLQELAAIERANRDWHSFKPRPSQSPAEAARVNRLAEMLEGIMKAFNDDESNTLDVIAQFVQDKQGHSATATADAE